MKTAAELKRITKSRVEIILDAAEKAANKGKSSLDLYIHTEWNEHTDAGPYTNKTFNYTDSDLEEIKKSGYEVKVTRKDYYYGGFLWLEEIGTKTEYHTVSWDH